MRFKRHLFLALIGISVFAVSCSKDNDNGTDNPQGDENVVEVSGDISKNTTWKADKIYHLNGFVYVTDGAELTIEPGTLIKGDRAKRSTLVITRGSKINAVGTAEKPIVFTSSQPAGSRREGDWGGVILLGKAPVNKGNDVEIEGGLTPTNGGDVKKYRSYGGSDAADNSGKLKYVRIEYAGVAFSVDNEINGLTLGGVGSGTEIDYVQVYRSGDDAFEFFGGTVNAKHLLAVGTWDDDFDTDFGYSGKIQFALAQRFVNVADVSGSNGFESDNDGDGSGATPQTSGVFSNVTIIGPYYKNANGEATKPNANFQHAAQIRRNSSLSILNSVFAGYTEGIYFDDTKGTAASANLIAGRSVFANNIVYGMKANEVKGENKQNFETALRANNVFAPTLFGADLYNSPTAYSSEFSKNPGVPDFTLKTGSIAATDASFTNAKVSDSFFERVAYKGAFGTQNWAASWTSFDPQSLPYDAPGKVK